MNVLWAVNLIPVPAGKSLGISSDVLGGWVESMAEQIKQYDDINLSIACKAEAGQNFSCEVDGIKYFSLAYEGSDLLASLKKQCTDIIEKVSPDLIQIEGTEFIHAKAMLETAKEKKIPCVVSLQGILNGQYNYQCGQLQIDDMMFSRSLTDITAAWLLHLRKTRWYAGRLPAEREIISQADYILGRTTWDRAHSYKLNPAAKYYSVNRILRAPFYENHWSYDKMEPHSIYVGNGYYALKGAHNVIMALPQLIREYPDIKLYIAGHKPFYEGDKRPFFKKGYGAYLEKLIKDLKVGKHVIFTGPLKADEVAKKLAAVNVYVLSSAAENSPNTLGEAMTVGTPCVAAYVGGVPDMATDGKEALLYRNDDPALLAWKVKQIFDSKELALSLSESGRKRAAITHDPKLNAEKLVECYKDILAK